MTKFDTHREKIIVISLVVIAALIRFVGLGAFPPGNQNSFLFRFITALCATASVLFLYFIVKKRTTQRYLPFATAITFALMPWHIEQSRIYSPTLITLTLFLGVKASLDYFNIKNKVLSIGACSAPLILNILLFPQASIFKQITPVAPLTFLQNISVLVSYDFLFFKNESFWEGGLRSYGVFLPFTFIVFTIGLFELIRRVNKKHIPHAIIFIVCVVLSALNIYFPEGNIYFFATPFFALVGGYGILSLYNAWQDKNIFKRIGIGLYILLVIYEHIVFMHFYAMHYSQRVVHEASLENSKF